MPCLTVRETDPLVREILHGELWQQVAKKFSGREPEGAWLQDELIGGKATVTECDCRMWCGMI
jgi:hypothetical protein